MSGTYRNTIVRDGYFGFGNTARKGAASIKKMDRRLQRREAARIELEAMAEFEEDCAVALEEAIEEYLGAEWYDDEPMTPLSWDDVEYPYEPDYFSEPDDFDYGMSYSDIFGGRDY